MVDSTENLVKIKYYDFSFGYLGQVFRIGVYLENINFEVFKEFYDLLNSENRDSEIKCGNLLKKHRGTVIDLGKDLRIFSTKRLYSQVAKAVYDIISRNLENTKTNLGSIAKQKFGSSNSSNTVSDFDMSTSTTTTSAEPDLSECLKLLPKYSEDIKFRSYRRQMKAYFSMVHVITDQKKLQLLEYAVARFDRPAVMLDDITSSGETNYEIIMDRLVGCLDGVTPMTKAEATKKALSFTLTN